MSLSRATAKMSKERESKRESFSEKAKKTFWWVVKVGVIAGVSVAALHVAISLL